MNRWLMLLMTVAFSVWGASASGASPALVYVFNAGSKDITVIDATTNAVIKTIPLGVSVRWLSNEQRPFDGRYLWTYEVSGGRMEHGEPVAGTVNALVIDPRSWTIVRRIPVGKGSAFGVALTPDRKIALVNIGEENAVAAIDVATFRIVRKISTGKFPCDVHITADGVKAFVPERDQDTVAAIDLSTWQVTGPRTVPSRQPAAHAARFARQTLRVGANGACEDKRGSRCEDAQGCKPAALRQGSGNERVQPGWKIFIRDALQRHVRFSDRHANLQGNQADQSWKDAGCCGLPARRQVCLRRSYRSKRRGGDRRVNPECGEHVSRRKAALGCTGDVAASVSP